MHLRMLFAAVCLAAVLPFCGCSDQQQDLDFSVKWPEKFLQSDEPEITADSYRSRNLCIHMQTVHTGTYPGDADADGTVCLADAVQMAQTVSGSRTNPLNSPENADCTQDGNMDSADVTALLTHLSTHDGETGIWADTSLTYHIADIYLRDIDAFRGAFAGGEFPETGSKQLESVQNMAADNQAVLAINCDYCEIRDNGITIRNGIVYRETPRAEVCVLYRSGEADVLTDAEYRKLSKRKKRTIWQTAAFAPGLVKDGQPVSAFSGDLYTVKHPRSGFGYYEPGHYCFVQVDGRQPGYSVGVDLYEFADIFASLDVQEAYNLDGGSSSEIVFCGRTYNRPSGIQTGTTGGRNNSDILYIADQ